MPCFVPAHGFAAGYARVVLTNCTHTVLCEYRKQKCVSVLFQHVTAAVMGVACMAGEESGAPQDRRSPVEPYKVTEVMPLHAGE